MHGRRNASNVSGATVVLWASTLLALVNPSDPEAVLPPTARPSTTTRRSTITATTTTTAAAAVDAPPHGALKRFPHGIAVAAEAQDQIRTGAYHGAQQRCGCCGLRCAAKSLADPRPTVATTEPRGDGDARQGGGALGRGLTAQALHQDGRGGGTTTTTHHDGRRQHTVHQLTGRAFQHAVTIIGIVRYVRQDGLHQAPVRTVVCCRLMGRSSSPTHTNSHQAVQRLNDLAAKGGWLDGDSSFLLSRVLGTQPEGQGQVPQQFGGAIPQDRLVVVIRMMLMQPSQKRGRGVIGTPAVGTNRGC